MPSCRCFDTIGPRALLSLPLAITPPCEPARSSGPNAVNLANSHTERRSDSASTHPKKQDSLSMTVGTESKCSLKLTALPPASLNRKRSLAPLRCYRAKGSRTRMIPNPFANILITRQLLIYCKNSLLFGNDNTEKHVFFLIR